MSKSQYVDFRAVRSAITMEQVLDHYSIMDKFKRNGDSLSGPCPIHEGSNPTQFRVSISKNVWNCFSECKHGGNTLDFISRMEKVSIHAAALKAIEWFDLDKEAMSGDRKQAEEESEEVSSNGDRPKPKPAARPSDKPENNTPNKPLKFRLDKLQRDHSYLTQERGLTQETIVDFGIGHCQKGMMEGRIAIPIHNSTGDVMAYAGRHVGEPTEDKPKYKLPPGFRKSLEVFNIDRATKEPAEKPLIIVEGFFDCMKLHQNGWPKVVALMGSTMSPAQEKLIREHTRPDSHVIVMLDEDEAGQAGREDIAARLAKHCFVKVHEFPEPDTQPEQLAVEDLAEILEGFQ